MSKIRNIGVLAGLLGLLTCSPLSAQGWEWLRKAGGSTSGPGTIDEEGSKIVSDKQGNVYVAGIMYPNAYFDTVFVPGYGDSDFFLASYDSLGKLRWVRPIGTNGSEHQQRNLGLAVDHGGNVYICGTVRASNQIRIGDSILSSPNQIVKFFVASFTGTGLTRWARVSTSGSLGYALATDSVFGLVCSYAGVNAGTLYGPYTLPTGSHLLRFSLQGDFIESFAVGSNHVPLTLAIYNSLIMFAGTFNTSAIILSDTINSLASPTSANAYLAIMDTNGVPVNTIGLYSIFSVLRPQIICDKDTVVLFATVGGANFFVGNTNIPTGTTSGQFFIGKIDLNGNVIWSSRSTNQIACPSGGLSVDKGIISVTGAHGGTTPWLGGSLTSSAAGYNPLFVQLTTSGSLIRMTELPGSGFNDYGNAVTSTGVITGSFDQSLFGFNDTVTKTGGGSDIFIARYNPNLIVTGVSPEVIARQVALYPNPLGQGVGLHISLGSYEQAELRVIDPQGKEVHRSMLQGPEATVQFRSIAPGQYLWQLKLGHKWYKGKLRVEG
jgi:hypothetical protein